MIKPDWCTCDHSYGAHECGVCQIVIGEYTGDFPLEYEYRAINPVNGPVCDVSTAIALVTEVHGEAWAESQWGDVYCCDDGDCEECMEGVDD